MDVTVTAIAALGAARSDYSHIRDTISQLGERGAIRAKFASRGVFIPVGLGLWAIAADVVPRAPHVALLALCLGIGYVIGGAFPCDPGLPPHGSLRQSMHDAGGLIEYAGAAYALLQLDPRSPALHIVFTAAAVFAPVAAASAFIPGLRRARGLTQRVAELALFASLALAVLRCLK